MEHHYEKELVINNREFKYRGIFKLDEVFSTINKILDEKGYEKREKLNQELVTESGKKIYFGRGRSKWRGSAVRPDGRRISGLSIVIYDDEQV